MPAERTEMSVDEIRAGGSRVISNDEWPLVRLDITRPLPGIEQYSVRGLVPLQREALASLLQSPLGETQASWPDVHRGLRAVVSPSRRVKAMTRSALMLEQYQEVKGSAWELAEVFANSTDYQTVTANVPVFTYAEAQQYIITTLFQQISEKKLPMILKDLDMEDDQKRRLQVALPRFLQTPEAVRELEEVTGMFGGEESLLDYGDSFDFMESKLIVELVHRWQAKYFVGFKEEARFVDRQLVGGSNKPTVYIRNQDVPYGVLRDDEQGAAISSDGVILSPILPDADRQTGLDRRRVTFVSDATRHVALPLLTWRKDQDGNRNFEFQGSKLEQKPEYDDLIRPSTLAGVALAASRVGLLKGIDYRGALTKLGSRYASFDDTGLWPLVATYRQEDVLGDSYFEQIEKRLQ